MSRVVREPTEERQVPCGNHCNRWFVSEAARKNHLKAKRRRAEWEAKWAVEAIWRREDQAEAIREERERDISALMGRKPRGELYNG